MPRTTKPPKARAFKAKAGVIGLGNMGHGVAANLARAGVPLAVWDVSDKAMAAFSGKKGVKVLTPAEMAAECTVVFFVVPTSKDIEGLLKGRDGLLARARPGLAVYDMTTSDPVDTQKLAKLAAKKDVAYLDAGMSGGAIGAEAGTLTLMIGGDAAAFKKTRRFLKAFAKNPFHLGPSGAGHTMKILQNMVTHTNFLAACEAGQMAEKAGIKLEDMITVFNVANARSFISEVRFPRHIIPKKWNGQSRVFNLHKDLGMAVKLSKKLGVIAKLGEGTYEFLSRAIDRGMQEKDFTLLYRDFMKIRKGKNTRSRA